MNKTLPEKIEKYIGGDMNSEERSLFESEAASNKELASLLDIYKTIETEMRNREKYNEAEAGLKDSLKKLNAVYFDKETPDNELKEEKDLQEKAKDTPVPALRNTRPARLNKKRRIIKTWETVAVAAATISIIALAITWYFQNKEENTVVALDIKKIDTAAKITKSDTALLQKNIPSPNLTAQNNNDTNAAENKQPHTLPKKKQEELFFASFEPDAIPGNIAGPLEDAFVYYDNHEYANAAAEFTTAGQGSTRGLETDPKLTAFYADYYAGLSYLAGGKTSQAITELINALNKRPEDLFKIKAQWYLALAYLKTGEIEKVNGLLITILANHNDTQYRLQATKLLAELK